MEEQDFHRGITGSDCKVNDKNYSFASGFMGVEFLEQPDPRYEGDVMQYVKPAVGWALYEEKPDSAEKVFNPADTTVKMFGE